MSDAIITALIAAVSSSGVCSIVQYCMQKKDQKKKGVSAQEEMVRGLGHDRICYLAKCYIARGYITVDEYENLNEYLYEPYKKLGGNGTAKMLMGEIEKLPKRSQKEDGTE